jgi:hypothetical protein
VGSDTTPTKQTVLELGANAPTRRTPAGFPGEHDR